MSDPGRFQRAIAAIDALNSEDPQRVSVRGVHGPKEIVHARLASEWVRRLAREPSEALLLAARAHHLRRWEVPRSTQPAGRAGYLRWRRGLYEFHAQACAAVLRGEGYAEPEISAVSRLIRKADLATDPEAQTLEDALCLVFIETQAQDFAAREPAKVKRVIAKTLRKMSAEARAAARELELDEALCALLHDSLPQP